MSKRTRAHLDDFIDHLTNTITEQTDNPTDYHHIIQQLSYRLKQRKLSSLAHLLNNLNIDEWIQVYSFIGMEHLFINNMFAIDRNMMENMYDSPIFWRCVFQTLWKGDVSNYDWTFMRTYCFHKYYSWKMQKELNPHVMEGFSEGMEIKRIKSNPVVNEMRSYCHVVKMIDPTSYNLETLDRYEGPYCNSGINWVVNCYLREKPICLAIHIAGRCTNMAGSQGYDVNLSIKTKVVLCPNNTENKSEWTILLGDNAIVILGIKELFNKLALDEHILDSLDNSKTVFEKDKIGKIQDEKHFLWFSNLIHDIPFPGLRHLLTTYAYCCEDFFETDEEQIKTLLQYYTSADINEED